MADCNFCGVPDVHSTNHYNDPCTPFMKQLRKVVDLAREVDNYTISSRRTPVSHWDVKMREALEELHREHAEQATEVKE